MIVTPLRSFFSSPESYPSLAGRGFSTDLIVHSAEPVLPEQVAPLDTTAPGGSSDSLTRSTGAQRRVEEKPLDRDELGGGGVTPGRVLVFMHVAGGAGATTVAVNTACALNEAGSPRTSCLIDLDIQFGGVASLLDMPCSSALQGLIDDPLRLERIPFGQMFISHSTGVQVVTAPRAPVSLHSLQPSALAGLLEASRYRFRFVVVDMPVAIASWTDVALGMASQIYLVTPMNVPAAHRVARFFHLLQQHDLGHLPIKIVVNREMKAGKNGTIPSGEFETAIGRPVDHRIPEEFALVQQSHNQGTPAVRLAPKSGFSQAIGELASAESGIALAAKPKRGLFHRS